MKQLSLTFIGLLLSLSTVAQSSTTDSSRVAHALEGTISCPQAEQNFRAQQLIAPTALIAIGALGRTNGWLRKQNRNIADDVASHHSSHLRIDNYTRFLPLTAVYALPLFHVQPRHNLRERLAVSMTATALAGGSTWGLKHLVKADRPDLSDRQSFPSGHTAFAFMGAEILRTEYWEASPWIGIGGYAVAAGTGYLRMYNKKHYFTDVLAGAGIGIFSARIAYWLLPWERKILGWEKQQKVVMLTPYANTESIGLSYGMIF